LLSDQAPAKKACEILKRNRFGELSVVSKIFVITEKPTFDGMMAIIRDSY
jgi:hypothetical protein